MKSKTVIVSALLHVVVFGLALQVSKSKAARRATSVAVVNADKKKPKKEEDKPKPKPKPLLASARPQAAPSTAPSRMAPSHAPEPTQAAEAPTETGLTLGNSDGPGIDVGGPAVKAPVKGPGASGNKSEKAGPALKREKALSTKDNPEDDTCTEAPSKPQPLQRASEIEYTQEARANNIEGRLVLKITVAADGSVASVEVVSAVEPALDAAAVAAVKTWTFKPAMRCGKPMGGATFTLAKRFELSD